MDGFDTTSFTAEGAQRFWQGLYASVQERMDDCWAIRGFCKAMLDAYGDDADEAFYDVVGSSTLSQYLDECDAEPAYTSDDFKYNSFVDGLFGYIAELPADEALICLTNTIEFRGDYSARRQEAMDEIFRQLTGSDFEGFLVMCSQGA